MKVLMTTDAVGGVWTYAVELARALSERRVDVVLATMGPHPTDEQREMVAHVPRVTLEESSHRLEWMSNPWGDVELAGRWLLALERDHVPDVIHLNGYAHARLAWRAPTLVVAHSCVAGWWRAVHGEPLPASWSRYREVVLHGLRATHLVVAPTHAMLASLAADYGAFSTPTRVILNGRSPGSFASARKEPLVLTTGRAWDRAKNVATLDAAAAAIDWPLRVVGPTQSPDGEAAPPLRHALPEGRVTETGLRAWYARASIFASAARYEPFGLGPLEAALSGCALVLSDLPSLREVWREAAQYAPSADAAAFAERIQTLAHDEEALERAQRAAVERARAMSADVMGEAYLDAYAALLDGSLTIDSQEASHCAS